MKGCRIRMTVRPFHLEICSVFDLKWWWDESIWFLPSFRFRMNCPSTKPSQKTIFEITIPMTKATTTRAITFGLTNNAAKSWGWILVATSPLPDSLAWAWSNSLEEPSLVCPPLYLCLSPSSFNCIFSCRSFLTSWRSLINSSPESLEWDVCCVLDCCCCCCCCCCWCGELEMLDETDVSIAADDETEELNCEDGGGNGLVSPLLPETWSDALPVELVSDSACAEPERFETLDTFSKFDDEFTDPCSKTTRNFASEIAEAGVVFQNESKSKFADASIGAKAVWTINLCLDFSFDDSASNGCNITEITVVVFGSITPLLGRTQ